MNDVDKRLTDLEVKASFTEDTVEQLNRIVTSQQDQIDRLIREIAELRRQLAGLAEPGGFSSLRDELPPHY
jgi:SlyX protein